jgi:hypothetical protein
VYRQHDDDRQNAIGDTSGNGAGVLLLDPYAASYFPEAPEYDRRYEGVLEPSSLQLVNEMEITSSVLSTSDRIYMAVSPHTSIVLIADQQQIVSYLRNIYSGKLTQLGSASVSNLQGLVTMPSSDPDGFWQITLTDGDAAAQNVFGMTSVSISLDDAANATGLCANVDQELVVVVDGVNNTIYIYSSANGSLTFVNSIPYQQGVMQGTDCIYALPTGDRFVLVGGNDSVVRINLDTLSEAFTHLYGPITGFALEPDQGQIASLENGRLYSLTYGVALGTWDQSTLISRADSRGVYILELSELRDFTWDSTGVLRAKNGVDGVTALSGTYRGHVGVRSGYDYEDLYILVNNTLLHFDVADNVSSTSISTGLTMAG